MIKIGVKNLNYKSGNVHICKDMSLDVEEKVFYGVIGPNGSGKSTLLKQVCRILQPSSGDIQLNGRDMKTLSYKESAREIATLLQENETNFDFTVEEIVLMGRAPHHNVSATVSNEDKEIAASCLRLVNLEGWEDRIFTTLSGGEKQRTLLARALAQKTDILLLDEPTNNLDIGYQLRMFELLKTLPMTIFMIIHDMNLASRFCDKIVVVSDGEIIGTGTPEEIMTPDLFQKVFSVITDVTKDDEGKPFIKFLQSAF